MTEPQQDTPLQQGRRTPRLTGPIVTALWIATALGIAAEGIWPAEGLHSEVWELGSLAAALLLSTSALILWGFCAENRRREIVGEFAQKIIWEAGYEARDAKAEDTHTVYHLPSQQQWRRHGEPEHDRRR